MIFYAKKKFKLLVLALWLLVCNSGCEKTVAPTNGTSQFTPAPNCICQEKPHRVGRWDICKLSYYLEGFDSEAQKAEVVAALKKWEQHTDLRFIKALNKASANIVILRRVFSNHDKKIQVDSLKKYCPSLINEPILGITCFTGSSSICFEPTNANTRAIISLNKEIDWGTIYPNTGKTYTLYPTAVHEIGHALGLRHIDNPNALMYCYATGNNDVLSADDLNAVKQISLPSCPEIDFSFSGIVDSVEVVGEYPVGFLLEEYKFKSGDTFTGTYSFNPMTPNTGGFDTGDYLEAITHGAITFSNGWTGQGSDIRSGPFGTEVIRVVNDKLSGIGQIGMDSYFARTTMVEGPNILSTNLHISERQKHGRTRTMNLFLADSTGQAIGSTDLPLNPPPLNTFNTNSFIMAFGGDTEPNLWVHGHLVNWTK